MATETKRVLVKIEAIIQDPENGPAPVTMMTTGEMARDGDTITLTYTEVDEDAPENGETVVLTVRPDLICMDRQGEYGASLAFRPGKRYESSYRTPFGEIPLVVSRCQFTVGRTKDETTWELRLKYMMSVGGSPSIYHDMKVQWTTNIG